MRVLVHQQAHLGHHYQYVGHLLPSLLRVADDVIVAVTPNGLGSQEFEAFLATFSNRVRFLPALPEASQSYAYRERLSVHRDLREAVRRFEPDHVLIPSGDAQATAMTLYRALFRGAVPGRVPCEVGIHFGLGSAAMSAASALKDRLNLLNLAVSGASRIHLVNLLFYQQARNLGALGRRFVLLPHPVSPFDRMNPSEARRRLGVPEDGRYLGLAGSLDSRKAISELIAAFRRATPSARDRLLLAGWMNQAHQRTIEDQHQDLVASGRLIVINRFLDQQTFQAAISALDVVCTPYPRFAGLSSTLLEGVAAGRPILANDYGWSREIVRKFSLGWTCDVLDVPRFAEAIATALARSPEYMETEAVKRLLAFHTPENFGATWCQAIAERQSLPGPSPHSWSWVEEGAGAG
jgi:glycosyltransferase involved in cell wall biosynthesis